MPIDTSIYQGLIQPPKSLIGYTNDLDQADMAQTQLAQQKLNLIGAQRADADQQALRKLYSTPGFDPTKTENLPQIFAISPQAGTAAQKAALDAQKTQAETKHLDAQSEQSVATAQKLKTEHAIAVQAQIAQAAGAATDQASWDRGLQIAATLGADVTNIPKQFDPVVAKQLHDQALTGAQQLDAHYKELQAAETARHNKAGEGIQIRGQNMARDTAAANREAENNRAGLNPDGTPNADVAATVQAIGEYRMKPPTLQALRNPRMAAIMNQVAQQYPGFDATQYDMRQKAVKDFGTGPQGVQVQAANTALNHLDTLAKLADAQKNGDTPLFNQIANEYAKQTGQPAPTNLQGAVTLVGPEVSKAVVGAGGGQGDREKVDSALSALVKGSPSQAAGQIATMKEIFGGRLSEGARTYKRTTKLDNFEELLSPAAQSVLHSRGSGASTSGWKVEEVK
jgi:hypothetical protein